jgi:triosephosphate isomerase (TIM)
MNKVVVANWKMNPMTLKGAKALFAFVSKRVDGVKDCEVVFCPPFLYFSIFENRFPRNVKIGAQNCFFEKEGAFTGEISPSQLQDLGYNYVITGHSERRRYFSETNETINKKLKVILDSKMIPIFCVGETQEQRDRGETQKIIETHLTEGLDKISDSKIKEVGLCIAYEPVWAIGTGQPCDVEESQKMNLLIKKIISENYSPAILKSIKILYGGSVNSKNAAGYVKEAGYDGLLVGGASLKPDEFSQIVKNSL